MKPETNKGECVIREPLNFVERQVSVALVKLGCNVWILDRDLPDGASKCRRCDGDGWDSYLDICPDCHGRGYVYETA